MFGSYTYLYLCVCPSVFVFNPFSTGGGLSRSDKSNLGAVEFETQIPQTAVPGFQEQNARMCVCCV